MNFIAFILSYSFVWVISKLPDRMVYAFSDFIFLILFYLVGYRKDVVYQNIARSFPEKEEKEIKQIRKKFYRFFCDVTIESFASQNWSDEKIVKRYHIKNLEEVTKYTDAGRNLMVIAGHFGNWEWTSTFSISMKIHFIAVYKPLSNKYFDRWMKKVRNEGRNSIVPMDQTLRTVLKNEKMGRRYVFTMIADQRPLPNPGLYWLNFMNQDTPVFVGAEKISRKMGQVVFFNNIRKLKRGYYEIELVRITERPEETKEHEITDTYFRLLEEAIRDQPENYLWTHKRWKFSRSEMEIK